jgi:hypothetical protein
MSAQRNALGLPVHPNPEALKGRPKRDRGSCPIGEPAVFIQVVRMCLAAGLTTPSKLLLSTQRESTQQSSGNSAQLLIGDETEQF